MTFSLTQKGKVAYAHGQIAGVVNLLEVCDEVNQEWIKNALREVLSTLGEALEISPRASEKVEALLIESILNIRTGF